MDLISNDVFLMSWALLVALLLITIFDNPWGR
jgi:hypothetical protein